MKNEVVEAYFDPVACVTQEERRERIVALVKAVDRLLTQLDIDYWLDSGTLLGQFREQNVMLWDNDADIGITSAGYEKLRGLKVPVDVPDGYKLQVYDSELYDTDDRDANIPVRLVDTRFGFYVDGFVFHEAVVNDVEVLSTAASVSWHTCAKCLRVGTYEALLVITKAYVFPLIACDFADFRVVCPAQRTLYLDHLYGSDFRIPKPRH
ncbi:hypothetical protein Poli38472_001303 [Pythium oligandrum]|uniref:LicD/FKTN/FKRP nucleotidyltransferase domain-containing protein n=1 Tax=Pythium oligandrum TaxID=41045 RepID=A0A8K1CUL6_PYTOL|nr:hypothetical protein Poli38472_001303 [Pythium oligandrum]|eukprot:TMW69147.1 hypothetical protein Poli38472_001303 [Pythium oligandrum]